MEYTKGPWKIEGEGQATVGILATGHNHFIAFLQGWAQPQQDANAYLIAAAPDLLEALEEMYEICNMSSDDAPHRVKARAAITKARGYKHD